MKIRVLITTLLVIAALAAVTGCTSNNNSEWQRVVCSVQSINAGAPVVSAALNIGSDATNTSDDFVPIDFVPVLFWARAGNATMLIPDDGAFSAFIVTGYDLIWHPGENAPPEIADYNVTGGLMHARVPIDDEFVASVMVVDAEMKSEFYFNELLSGSRAPFSAFVELNFHGHEEGSEHDVVIPSGVYVSFVGEISSNN